MFGLLGKKLEHSFSKTIHEKFTNHQYELIETNNLNQFFTNANINGLNVTIPYKTECIQYLQGLSPEAKEINAVNTIISKDGKLFGYNTDYYGLTKLLEYNTISVKDKTIIILGNGSTSRTIFHYCEVNLAKKIIILARNPNENEYNLSTVENFDEASIVFNSTPVGMFPNNNQEPLIDLTKLPNCTSVIDVIYNPLRSNLIIEANKLKINTVNGLLMLLFQAVKSIELFHNLEIPDKDILEYYEELLFTKTNLVFIGMPMSGKSFLAKRNAKKYNKKLIDIDHEIVDYTNDSISNIFEDKGEPYFRNLESKITERFSKLNNQAISCGGGAVLKKENMVNLKHNGIIIFIDVPLSLLLKCNPRNRPLLKIEGNLENLYRDRYDLYKQYADVIVNKTSFDEKKTMHKLEVALNDYFSTKWT